VVILKRRLDPPIQLCAGGGRRTLGNGRYPGGWTRLPYLRILAHHDRPYLHYLPSFEILLKWCREKLQLTQYVAALKLASVKMGA
jgi:hypothetical protein